MEDFFTAINKMCLPAQLYLGISVLSILALLFQNIGQNNVYCIGSYESRLPCSNMTVFIFKILLISPIVFFIEKVIFFILFSFGLSIDNL